MIGIIDYGLGNLTSVAGAVIKVGYVPQITSDPIKLADCEKLILPGVGAFGDGMRNLNERRLIGPLSDIVENSKIPVLGICLGFQLFANSSTEFGDHKGLGWIDAEITKFELDDISLRIPHVGWNDLEQTTESILYQDIPNEALFYYVHTYRMKANNPSDVTGECDYGGKFPAVIQKGNIYGTQFHPEKSQQHGLTLLKNFLDRG